MTYKYPNVDLSGACAPLVGENGVSVTMSPFMAELVDAVAVKFPSWCIQGIALSRHTNTELHITGFKVWDDSNPRVNVGTLTMTKRYTQHGAEFVYVLNAPRISAARERGSTIQTKDLKVAFKAVKKYFTPPPLAERFEDLTHEAVQFSGGLYRRHDNQRQHVRSTVYPVIQHYIRSNWEDFIATIEPVHVPAIMELADMEHNCEHAKKFHEAVNANKVLTVLTDGDKYVVRYKERISKWDSDALPEDVRRSIGMLKLSDKHTLVEDVGVRIDKGFIIMPAENFSFDD